jgi:proteasome lid subunit RPN8/RPN11
MLMAAGMNIRISAPIALRPREACEPIGNSKRWDSPYDGEGLQPIVKVFFTQPAYCRVYVHSASEPDYEVGGALVGQWCSDRDSHEQFVVVEHVLPARFTRQGSVYLTFTQDTIVAFHKELEKRYPNKKIVGWYHTHPKMGVFLSHYDTWLHNHFFPEPWQVALVVEPLSSVGGFFIRQPAGILNPTHYSGFYELNGNFGKSAVRWHNLRSADEKSEGV